MGDTDEQPTSDSSTDISQLLGSWGYDQAMINKFKDEGIKPSHLIKMTEYSLEKLLPKIGERIDFMEKIATLKRDQEIPIKKRKIFSDRNSNASTSSATTLTNISTISYVSTLPELLESGAEGKMILSYYKTEKKLNDYYRQKLADEIVKQELKLDIAKSFPNSIIEYWSEQITSYFLEESYEVWAGCTQGKNRNSAAGRGILLTRYYNMRRKFFKVGALTKCQQNVTDKYSNNSDNETDEEHNDLIQWLNNTKTVQDVHENWTKTTKKRMSMLKTCTEIHTYMDSFPAVKSFDGYRLLVLDFETLYPDAVLKLYGEWPSLSTFIMSKLSAKERNTIEECCSSDGKKVKTIRALSLLFPIKNIIMGKKRQWRPSKLESKDGLFQYVKSYADIQPDINRKQQKFLELGLKLGPQLFAVSPDNDCITDCYLVINNIMYNINNPLKAFDIFMKSFHALYCCYPREAEREFYFLQKAVYEIQCETDSQIRDSKTVGLINEYIRFKPD